jgi:hypothetical protein
MRRRAVKFALGTSQGPNATLIQMTGPKFIEISSFYNPCPSCLKTVT